MHTCKPPPRGFYLAEARSKEPPGVRLWRFCIKPKGPEGPDMKPSAQTTSNTKHARSPPPSTPHHPQRTPAILLTSAPVSASQIFTRLSSEPLMTRIPSGENATERTQPACPSTGRCGFFDSRRVQMQPLAYACPMVRICQRIGY